MDFNLSRTGNEHNRIDDIVDEVVADLNTGSVSPRRTKRKTDEANTVNLMNTKRAKSASKLIDVSNC